MTQPEVLKVFIGYDAREPTAFWVLAHSILARASQPIAIIPLIRSQLGGIYWRQRGPTESTDFALTRFLVPYLSGFTGVSIFMDCDMLCQADLGGVVYDMIQKEKKAWVCPHDYVPKSGPKFLGQAQTSYPCKNWSSFMVFNNDLCRTLTPEYVNAATGLELHRFAWAGLGDIGHLPLDWNWLVGEYDERPDARVLHFTRGGPWFAESDHESPSAQRWLAAHAMMIGQPLEQRC